MLLTKSFSGLIGIVFSSILMFIFYFPKNRINKNILLILTVVLLNVIVLLVVKNTSRVVLYFDAFTTLYQALSNGDEVTSILKHTMNNIYPVWHRWTEVLNFNILPLFVGTGLGTSSVVNNVYLMKANVVINPQSNIVRMIFDVGIVGVFFLGYTFIAPIKRLFFQKEVRKKALILMLFILGAFFAHRSVAPFLFLGVLLATSKQLYVSMLMGRAVSMSSTET